MEPYLNDIKSRKVRVAITKLTLRLSDHCLMMEEGRHHRPIVPRDQRFCPYCPGEIEDEEHFFTKCTGYDRAPLFDSIILRVPQFGNLDDHNIVLLSSSFESSVLPLRDVIVAPFARSRVICGAQEVKQTSREHISHT